MLSGGEDPLFVARRLIRAAAEDIGEADPMSLLLANAAKDTYDFLGSPEVSMGGAYDRRGRRTMIGDQEPLGLRSWAQRSSRSRMCFSAPRPLGS
jgi:hypothetical protein